jgi:hypothetical protein
VPKVYYYVVIYFNASCDEGIINDNFIKLRKTPRQARGFCFVLEGIISSPSRKYSYTTPQSFFKLVYTYRSFRNDCFVRYYTLAFRKQRGINNLGLANSVHSCSTDWAFAFHCRFAIFHCNCLSARIFSLCSAFYTIHRCHIFKFKIQNSKFKIN